MPSAVDQMHEVYGASLLEQSFGVSVVLKRRRDSSDAFTATWTEQKYEVFDSDGQLSTVVQSRDFAFAVSDAVIDGVTVIPRAGDQLVVEGTDTFELLTIPGAPVAEKLPGDFRWLVHTKRIA